MIISISPHIITQNTKKVKSFFKKCLKNINGRAKRCWKEEKRKTNKKRFSNKVIAKQKKGLSQELIRKRLAQPFAIQFCEN